MNRIFRHTLVTLLLLAGAEKGITQNISVSGKFITAIGDKTSGDITVLPLDAQNFGRIGFDNQLSFGHHSYFTCKIGSNKYFTNNGTITLPSNAKLLPPGNTIKVSDVNKVCDTIRTTWLSVGDTKVDIIQDVYPIDFTKSGQIVFKWRFVNHTTQDITVACQYLNDIQISESHATGKPTNDGPIILTRYQYKPTWQQYPNVLNPLPWFYIGFVHDLPYAPTFDPGLSAMGIMDYGEPLNLIKPARLTIGEWYGLAQYLWGSNPAWPLGGQTPIGNDCATLVEFSPQSVPAGATIEAGRTAYGTGDYERCVGNLFSLVFYPHHLVWKDANPVGFYTPNPIHIEKFVFNPDKINSASNTNITLRVSDPLTLVDSLCTKPIGKSQTKPGGNGTFIGLGEVGYFDWWACASPANFCNGPVLDTLIFTAVCSTCNPAFVDADGDDECIMPITFDCAEADHDAPLHRDTVISQTVVAQIVSDSRPTDRGLASITAIAAPGTDTTKIVLLPVQPPVAGCFSDKIEHILRLEQRDSTVGGCYYLRYKDCLGYTSFDTLCIAAKTSSYPDSLPPVFIYTRLTSGGDTLSCTDPIDSFTVADNRLRDSGVCMIDTIPGLVRNYSFSRGAFQNQTPQAEAGFTIAVIDIAKDADICIRATDCSQAAHYTDTCFHYCAQNLGVGGASGKYDLSLEAANPNPFARATTITYALPHSGPMNLELFDELGRQIMIIEKQVKAEGAYTTRLDGTYLADGRYILRLEAGGNVVSRKIVVRK
ncbi:MAG: T9SS type A sorting domain-containing protein [Ignavibacteriota bacterium]